MTAWFKNVKLITERQVRRLAFDYSKLRGKIVEKYGTIHNFAKIYGISKTSMSRKMQNKSRFSSDDIIRMSKLLEIDKEDIGSYFFTKKV